MKTRDVLPAIKATTDVLTFGKYSGKTVEYVLDKYPGYIVWLVENSICDVSDEIYNDAEIYDREDDGYDYEWMEEPF